MIKQFLLVSFLTRFDSHVVTLLSIHFLELFLRSFNSIDFIFNIHFFNRFELCFHIYLLNLLDPLLCFGAWGFLITFNGKIIHFFLLVILLFVYIVIITLLDFIIGLMCGNYSLIFLNADFLILFGNLLKNWEFLLFIIDNFKY